MSRVFDAVLLVAFGGPEKKEDVLPFLRNVTRGRGISDERLEIVRQHYDALGGRSPLNEWTRRQAAALTIELRRRDHVLPVVCGMRNWHPFIADSLRTLVEKGARRIFAVILSAHDSPASRERYVDDVEKALAALGNRAPEIVFAPNWHDREGYITAAADRIEEATRSLGRAEKEAATLVFTAHSIPNSMAEECSYVDQFRRSAELVATNLDRTDWQIAYQSRSGRPQDPWLEPDIGEKLEECAQAGTEVVIVSPIGFVCDHVEVLWDLDEEAATRSEELGIKMVRAGTVAEHPAYIAMLADLFEEANE